MNFTDSNEARKAFLKGVFDYCMKVEWRRDDLDALASKLGKTRGQVRAWARMYVNKYLSYEEGKKVYALIDELTRKDQEVSRVAIKKVNPILYRLKGKVTYYLWENDDDKELVLKYIYNTLEKSYYDINKVNELSVFLGIFSEDRVLRYAKMYAIEYLGYTEEEYHEMRMEYGVKKLKLKQAKGNRVFKKDIYDKLLMVNSLEEVINILDNCDFLVNSLLNGVHDYVVLYKNGNDGVRKNLKNKLRMYSDYVFKEKKEERKQEKQLSEQLEKESKLLFAQQLINKFLNEFAGDRIDEFCKNNNITRSAFDEYVTILKELDADLFNNYIEKINNFKSQRFAIIISQIKNIVTYLKNGIEEFGIVRPFDLVDFYLCTNIDFNDVLKISKDIVSEKDYSLIKKFVNQNINGIINDTSFIKQVMNARVIINYQTDKNGMLIPGTEEIFSNEEKEQLINYLKENKVPINSKTYNIIYRRYRNGTLNLNVESKKK